MTLHGYIIKSIFIYNKPAIDNKQLPNTDALTMFAAENYT